MNVVHAVKSRKHVDWYYVLGEVMCLAGAMDETVITKIDSYVIIMVLDEWFVAANMLTEERELYSIDDVSRHDRSRVRMGEIFREEWGFDQHDRRYWQLKFDHPN